MQQQPEEYFHKTTEQTLLSLSIYIQIMKYWPVPNSYSKNIPTAASPGSFWENRGDRHHCGVDIYASEGSDVLSVEDGIVLEVDVFTSPEKIPYWNTTYYVLIKNKSGLICKYAELGDVKVKEDESVKAGHLIGHVGLVLNSKKINKTSPLYIQKINKNQKHSMLHFELYNNKPKSSKKYLGGNCFEDKKPDNLLDPTNYLINFT